MNPIMISLFLDLNNLNTTTNQVPTSLYYSYWKCNCWIAWHFDPLFALFQRRRSMKGWLEIHDSGDASQRWEEGESHKPMPLAPFLAKGKPSLMISGFVHNKIPIVGDPAIDTSTIYVLELVVSRASFLVFMEFMQVPVIGPGQSWSCWTWFVHPNQCQP
jgi:hypothetical protein